MRKLEQEKMGKVKCLCYIFFSRRLLIRFLERKICKGMRFYISLDYIKKLRSIKAYRPVSAYILHKLLMTKCSSARSSSVVSTYIYFCSFVCCISWKNVFNVEIQLTQYITKKRDIFMNKVQ